MKLMCRIFGHKWGMFVCLRCREVRPGVREIVKTLYDAMISSVNFWMELEEFKEKRDREYEEMRERPETTGEILKKLGIKREKIIRPEQIHIKLEQKPPIPEQIHIKLEQKWGPLIERMKTHPHEILKVTKNSYYGKIRGMDILLEARKDFKRLGIEAEFKLMGDYGTIRLSGPSREAR